MAVYEHTYKAYDGPLTPQWSRFLVIPRHAFRSVFGSKLFIAFFAICFVYPLVAAILIYLHHNETALAILQLALRELIPIDAWFFEVFVRTQAWFAFFLTLLVGPPLVSRDTSNNALSLYFCRPFSRAEYVIGKMSVLFLLISAITWVPALLLLLFQSYLEGLDWFRANIWLAGSILFSSLIWIFLLSLLSLAISAWVKWRMAASAALLAVYFIPAAFGQLINGLFYTRVGNLINLPSLISTITSGLFGRFTRDAGTMRMRSGGRWLQVSLVEPPLWSSWLVLALICAFCLFLLTRKVRAYEVVR